ncbi:MAG: hypothetical protein MJK04_16380, partial [Psychrosphaera sp.]|nr:hypothetical protein [Psychrosphaera sp.]
MYEPDTGKWVQDTFGNAQLNDKRLTRRLIKVTTDIAENPGLSLVKASGDAASIEGAYRFVRNSLVSPWAIAKSGFETTVRECAKRRLVLALEDTTGLNFTHDVCGDSTETSGPGKGRPLMSHSILALDADTETVIG